MCLGGALVFGQCCIYGLLAGVLPAIWIGFLIAFSIVYAETTTFTPPVKIYLGFSILCFSINLILLIWYLCFETRCRCHCREDRVAPV